MRKIILQVLTAALFSAAPACGALAQLPNQLPIVQQIHADFARERVLQIKGNSQLKQGLVRATVSHDTQAEGRIVAAIIEDDNNAILKAIAIGENFVNADSGAKAMTEAAELLEARASRVEADQLSTKSAGGLVFTERRDSAYQSHTGYAPPPVTNNEAFNHLAQLHTLRAVQLARAIDLLRASAQRLEARRSARGVP